MANEGQGKVDRIVFTGDPAKDQLARLAQFDTPEAQATRAAAKTAAASRPAPKALPKMATPTKKLTYVDI